MVGDGQVVVAARLALARDARHDLGRGQRAAIGQVESELHSRSPTVTRRRSLRRGQLPARAKKQWAKPRVWVSGNEQQCWLLQQMTDAWITDTDPPGPSTTNK